MCVLDRTGQENWTKLKSKRFDSCVILFNERSIKKGDYSIEKNVEIKIKMALLYTHTKTRGRYTGWIESRGYDMSSSLIVYAANVTKQFSF